MTFMHRESWYLNPHIDLYGDNKQCAAERLQNAKNEVRALITSKYSFIPQVTLIFNLISDNDANLVEIAHRYMSDNVEMAVRLDLESMDALLAIANERDLRKFKANILNVLAKHDNSGFTQAEKDSLKKYNMHVLLSDELRLKQYRIMRKINNL